MAKVKIKNIFFFAHRLLCARVQRFFHPKSWFWFPCNIQQSPPELDTKRAIPHTFQHFQVHHNLVGTQLTLMVRYFKYRPRTPAHRDLLSLTYCLLNDGLQQAPHTSQSPRKRVLLLTLSPLTLFSFTGTILPHFAWFLQTVLRAILGKGCFSDPLYEGFYFFAI